MGVHGRRIPNRRPWSLFVFVTKCFYQQGNETFSEGEDEKAVIVNAEHFEEHVPFVRDRLKRAGIRLADLLNRTLGQ